MAKIVFMGTPEYAKIILQEHLKYDEVLAVVTQPDKPVGRKRVITASPVKELALSHGIDCLQPQRIDDSFAATIASYNPEFLIVAAYGQILPQSVLDVAIPINLHASLLPKYRGASPVQECLLHGDDFTGVTAMYMEKGLDSGPILGYRAFVLEEQMKLVLLMQQLSFVAARLSVDVVQSYQSIIPLVQNGAQKSYCKKIKSEDGLIELKSAKNIDAKFKAYYGWPGIYLQSGLKLKEIILNETQSKNNAGEILSIMDEGVIIGCKRGSIKVLRVQPSGKKEMDSKSYINGKRLNIGDTLL